MTKKAMRHKRLIPYDEAMAFLRLIDKLDRFVAEKSDIIKKIAAIGKPVEVSYVQKEIRDYWQQNLDFIDQFLMSVEAKDLTEDQRQLVLSWKKGLFGDFVCVKYYAGYAVFRPMNDDDGNHYAVLALTTDFYEMLPIDPPSIVSTSLLPYKDMIIWDGLAGQRPLLFGRNMCREFEEELQACRKEKRIITRLI